MIFLVNKRSGIFGELTNFIQQKKLKNESGHNQIRNSLCNPTACAD